MASRPLTAPLAPPHPSTSPPAVVNSPCTRSLAWKSLRDNFQFCNTLRRYNRILREEDVKSGRRLVTACGINAQQREFIISEVAVIIHQVFERFMYTTLVDENLQHKKFKCVVDVDDVLLECMHQIRVRCESRLNWLRTQHPQEFMEHSKLEFDEDEDEKKEKLQNMKFKSYKPLNMSP